MRRIKLVLSDLHLGKGRIDEFGRLNPLEDFHDDERFIEFIRHYGGEAYEDAEVELIINGDFLELLVVDEFDVLPNRETEQTGVWKVQRIFDGHKPVFEALRAFASRPNRSITFTIGNHDAALLFPRVRDALIASIGGATRVIERSYDFSCIHIEHGNHYEYIHAFNARNYSYRDARGEKIFRMPVGSLFIMEFLSALKKDRPYIDKVKPFRIYLKYAFVNDHMFFWTMLVRLVQFWMRNRLSRDPVRRREFALSLTRGRHAMTHVSMDQAAFEILRKTNYRYVIFGHSHKHGHERLGDYGEYINTGSWVEMVSLELPNLGKRNDRMFAFIDCTDWDNPVVRLKTWIGSHELERDVG
ncbi:metallophosphoesterase [bacterium]|nr:metallophosphoesterase [bacterium]